MRDRSTDTTRPKQIEVTIERIVPGGLGLAHAEGLTVFVPLAAPGDLVRARIDRVRGKVAFASITEVITPSPVRVAPPCPYFARCGGCDFQQMTYRAQLDAKIEIIRDCLHRIGRIEQVPEISITPSPNEWHYRSRANWQIDPEKQSLGYFERGSHRVCDVAECAILVPELQQTLDELRAQLPSLPENIGDFEAAAGVDGVSVSPLLAGLQTREISRTIDGETYRFNAASFFQINHELLGLLIAEALRNARGATAVDLYCGVGLFTVPLARRLSKVIGVEANPHASQFARGNLRHAQLSNAEIVNQRVDDWLRGREVSSGVIDFLLLDPPRTGVESAALEHIIAMRPGHISYVSCDPATLSRDLRALLAGGYSLSSVTAVDMFPQTHHVETVVHLLVGVPP